MSDRAKTKVRARIRKQKVHSIMVVRSNKHMSVHLASPEGIILAGMSTMSASMKKKLKCTSNVEAASVLGAEFAKLVKKNHDLKHVAFDRSGLRYHGRVQAVGSALRDAGIID